MMLSTDSSPIGARHDNSEASNAQHHDPGIYRHDSLPPRHVRLLQILEVGEQINCELQHFPLEQCPQYHALSYAWGPGDFCHRILIGGSKYHLITKHLYQGLISIGQVLSPLWLWIDQICINQADSEDKTGQVALMGDIYANAIRTIVWLGPAYEKSDLAMSHVTSLAGLIRKQEFNASLATASAVELGFPHENEQVWPAFQRLFDRPWWKRLWIIQEAVKAQDIVFVVGRQVALYDDLIVLALAHERYIQLVPNGTYKLGILSGLSKAFYALRNEVLVNISQFRSGKYASVDGEMSNSNVIQLLGNVQVVTEFGRIQLCTEPVDRVYALLGLVGDQVRSKVKIDYSDENRKQYWRTYLHFYRRLLEIFLGAGYWFTTLFSGQHNANTPASLPSWCPDLGNPGVANHPYATGEGAGNVPSSISWKPCSRQTEPCNSNLSILHVNGIRIDRIKTLVTLWSAPRPVLFDKFTCQDATNVKTSLQACLELAATMKRSSEDVEWIHVLFRTLVMNTRAFSANMYPADTIMTDCRAFIDRLTAIIDHSHQGKEFDATEVSEGASRYASSFFEFTRDRVLFMTEGGRLGLCNAAAAVGDEVVVWFGCMFPVMQRVIPGVGGCGPPSTNLDDPAVDSAARTWLPGKYPGERREQQHRKLLGLCYVDGSMRGEIFSERDVSQEGYSNFLIV